MQTNVKKSLILMVWLSLALLPACPSWALPAAQAVPGQSFVNPIDGAQLLWIPPGPFLMGNNDHLDNPNHTVTLSGYWMYKNDVTAAMYRKFCKATGRKMPLAPSWGWKDNHPIVHVTWDDAKAYCDWARVHLPTEAQWEKAARGTDGRKYPWGNNWDSSLLQCSKSTYNDARSTAPVGSFPAGASPYGCLDMAGNVWQWCADWYDDSYWKSEHGKDPTGPISGDRHVLRGGSYYYFSIIDSHEYLRYFRAAYRDYNGQFAPGIMDDNDGFRGASGP